MSKYYKAEDVEWVLEKLAREPNYKHADEEWFEGVVLARDRIEDLPTIEVSEDCIGRTTVLEIYSDLYWIDERLLNFKSELDKVYDELRNAPSVIPQAKEGEWIEGETFYFCGEQQMPMKCSVCGRTALNEPWTYCPNCGAKMKGADDEA